MDRVSIEDELRRHFGPARAALGSALSEVRACFASPDCLAGVLNEMGPGLTPDRAILAWVDTETKAGDVKEHWVCVVLSTGDPHWEPLPGTGPGGNGMSTNQKSQGQWLSTIKTHGCNSCHQIGNLPTRTIYTINATDGSDPQAVHPGPGPQFVPGWQPLGTRLALQASNIAPIAEFVQVHLGM